MAYRFKKGRGNFWQGKLVYEALLAVNREKVDLLLWIDPGWNIMRQHLSGWKFHWSRIVKMLRKNKHSLVGTSRCDVRSADGPAVRPYHVQRRTARRSVPTNDQSGRPGGLSLPTIRADGPAVRPYQRSERTARRSVPTTFRK